VQENLERLLTEADAAEMLAVSVRSIRTERMAGRLPWLKVAGKVRLRRSDVLTYVESSLCLAPQREPASVTRPAARISISTGLRKESSGDAARALATCQKLKGSSLN
jgi:excisionase family DNA binding protein